MPTVEVLRQMEASGDHVLAVDFDRMVCVEATVDNVSEWGCRLNGEHVRELHKSIAIRPPNQLKMIRCQVTAVKGSCASVIFSKKAEKQTEQRRERRNSVNIPVIISDQGGVTEIKGTIVDAGQNGCRVLAKGLTSLPEDVVLKIKQFERPVHGEFAWRNDLGAGLRLVWEEGETIG